MDTIPGAESGNGPRNATITDMKRIGGQQKKTAPGAVRNPLLEALAFHQQGHLARAEEGYRQILARTPQDTDALQLLGALCLQGGRAGEAVALLREVLRLRPELAQVHSNLAAALRETGALADALAASDAALRLQPDLVDAMAVRSNVLLSLRRFVEALAWADKVLAIQPGNPFALVYKGNALRGLNRPHEALACYRQVLAANPRHHDAAINHASALQESGELHAALDELTRLHPLFPGDVALHFNEAICRLRLGDWPRGLALYEWRWKEGQLAPSARAFTQPLWLGQQPVAGRTVLLHAEQGLGDTVNFCRYAALVKERGARVVLEVQPPLKPLLISLEGVDCLLARGEPLPQFDFQTPLASLPLALGTTPETVPSRAAYLDAEDGKVRLWEERLGPRQGLRVGLVWSGAAGFMDDSRRSIPLELLAGLLDLPVVFSCLQKEVRDGDRSWLAANATSRVRLHGADFHDFAATAALIACMDLVISVDTSVAHVAAALGKPVWLMLPAVPDWRWGMEGDRTPWYPSMRLFRQNKTRRWEDVIDAVVTALHGEVERYEADRAS